MLFNHTFHLLASDPDDKMSEKGYQRKTVTLSCVIALSHEHRADTISHLVFRLYNPLPSEIYRGSCTVRPAVTYVSLG